jgi:hypothetical protein
MIYKAIYSKFEKPLEFIVKSNKELSELSDLEHFDYLDFRHNSYIISGKFSNYKYEEITDQILIDHYTKCFKDKQFHTLRYPLNHLIKKIINEIHI